MNPYCNIRVLILSIIGLISQTGCYETKWVECNEPYLTLDDLIANKNYMTSKFDNIWMERNARWKRLSEDSYLFMVAGKCRGILYYRSGNWDFSNLLKEPCKNNYKMATDCRFLCDSMHIADLKIFKTPSKTEYVLGFNLQCVDITSINLNKNFINKYRFIYLINTDRNKPELEGINSNIYTFDYKDHRFCLSEY